MGGGPSSLMYCGNTTPSLRLPELPGESHIICVTSFRFDLQLPLNYLLSYNHTCSFRVFPSCLKKRASFFLRRTANSLEGNDVFFPVTIMPHITTLVPQRLQFSKHFHNREGRIALISVESGGGSKHL